MPANNVGDTITFRLSSAPSDGGGSAYVWNWWDGTSDATKVPQVDKKLNLGGTLAVQLIQCDQFGHSQTYNGSIVVNFPPVVSGSPTVSNNDSAFPFDTLMSSRSYDPEHPGGTELTFQWYDAGTLLGSGTTQVNSGTYLNSLAAHITSDKTFTQVITDTLNGVTRINYFVRGFTPDGLKGSSSTISNSIVSSANNLSQIIIGPDQTATFTAYAQDTSSGQLQFTWSAGTLNGWSSDLTVVDTPHQLPNGLYKSQIVRQIGTETSGLKIAACTVLNLTTNQSIDFNTSVTLISPLPPEITSISTDAPIINGGYAVSQAGFVHFSATASDPNNALLSYKWDFTQPSVTLYGRSVMLRPADYSIFDEAGLVGSGTNPGTGPLPIIGQVTVSDRFNQVSVVSLNQFATALVWPYTQVSPETSGTGSTTLQKRYWGLLDTAVLSANDLDSMNSDFAAQRNQSNTFGPLAQYIYIVYPASMGNAIISVNGSVVSDWLLSVSTFNSVNYNVYRSSTPMTGVFQVTIN